ncbi:MAG: hypothetical protein Fur0018_24990 [Anaerolineales bacterium]
MSLIGRTARRPHLARDIGIMPLGMLLDGDLVLTDHLPAAQHIQAGDIWLVAGETNPENLARLGLAERNIKTWRTLDVEDAVLAEVALNPRGAAAFLSGHLLAWMGPGVPPWAVAGILPQSPLGWHR